MESIPGSGFCRESLSARWFAYNLHRAPVAGKLEPGLGRLEGTPTLHSASRSLLLALLVALVALLSACAAAPEPQVPLGQASFRSLGAGATLGQTFVVHHDGLSGVQVFLQPETPGAGTVTAELQEVAGGPVLASASVPLGAIAAPGMVSFAFAAPLASRQQDYYLQLAVQGEGSLQAAVMPGPSYRDGSLYSQGRPADGQLVHAHLFAPLPRLLGFALRLLGASWSIVLGLLVCAVPGLGLLAALDRPGRERDWAELLALAIGGGVTLLTIWLLWARLLGLRLGPWNVWLPVILGAIPLLWRARGVRATTLRGWRPRVGGQDLGLITLLLLITLVRLLVVGSLEAPMWGDSYQHAMITQLMLDNGGLFDSWAPYEHYATFTVQYGFSAVAAALAWASGVGAVEATILAGQLLNAAAAITLYPLAVRLAGGSRWAGVAALIVAGLLSLLPGYYVNWGRYAQLSGQVVLPVAMMLTWDLLEAPRRGIRPAIMVGLVVAGMTLCYYRTLFFYVAFVGTLLLCWALPSWRLSWRLWLRGAGWLALAGAATGLFFAPWVAHVATSQLAATVGEAAAQGTPLDYVRADYLAWGLLTTYMPLPLLILSGAALLWALLRREWMLPGLALWTLLLAGYMATSLYGVPGAVMLQSFSVMIAAYMPVALACGWLAARLVGLMQRPDLLATHHSLLPALALLGLALWGGLQQLRIVEPANIYVTRPDSKAMGWIASATPPEARFLVQGFDVYGGTSVVGADGGWWIPLLTGRENTMPPQYAIANERPEPADYTRRVVDLVHTLRATPPTTPEGMQALCAEGVTHLYTGQGQGLVGTAGPPLFSPADLAQSSHFTLRYAEDRVTIFSFEREVCAQASAPAAAQVSHGRP